jgi:protein-S-isoprenylcysteine O-methyltransferase Ste14
MSDVEIHRVATVAMLLAAPVTLLVTLKVDAPYGRHARAGWGPVVSSRAGWILMEAPAAIAFSAFVLTADQAGLYGTRALLGLWLLHYVPRAFVYPLLLRSPGRPMPLAIPAMGVLFNLWNAYCNGRWVGRYRVYDGAWLSDPRFVVGAILFVLGFALNQQSDAILRGLRAPGSSAYSIPTGGLYRWVSCPNYFGEILTWTGWAIATWSLPGLAFLLYTVANLGPRALANHRWYRATFADYPAERRALVPFLV